MTPRLVFASPRSNQRMPLLIFISGLSMVAALAFLIWPGRSEEPVYKGKSLSYWTRLYVSPQFPMVGSFVASPTADEAIHHIGTNAIPFLLRWAAYDSSPGQKRFRRLPGFLQRMPYVDRLFYSEQKDGLGLAACQALITLGPEARPALPGLRTLLGRTDGGFATTRALSVLVHLGAPAVPILVEAATDPSNDLRLVIISSLGALGSEGTGAVPSLTLLLRDPDPFVRHNSVRALALITGQPATNFNTTLPASAK